MDESPIGAMDRYLASLPPCKRQHLQHYRTMLVNLVNNLQNERTKTEDTTKVCPKCKQEIRP